MGRHNGKARAQGLPVGRALINKQRASRHVTEYSGDAQSRHTTDMSANKQSIIDMNDLDELMDMATLAERDFTADRSRDPIVLTTGTEGLSQVSEEERKNLEKEHAHRLTVPRRPPWTSDTTTEELDAQEKVAFLEWRRNIAIAEQESGLSVTPFEKNLEVWRQLWRVLERSHVVAQVVDARNPLFYFCEDLSKYAMDLKPPKRTVLILNKAELLSLDHRKAWAEYFRERDIPCCFFSAKRESPNNIKQESCVASEEAESAETKVLTREELISKLEDYAVWSLDQAGAPDPRSLEKATRLMVGLVGFPNVGKSSTINALKGEKKTVVSSTPGKTKHFQTLNVSKEVCVCDCPGLVFPRFAESRAYMIVSGVLPIDKLSNDVSDPLDIVASHFSRAFLSNFYHLSLSPEESKAKDIVSGKQLADSYATHRGLILMGGRPDAMKGGRKVLKDYIDGKLCYCYAPPGVHIDERSVDEILEATGNKKIVEEKYENMKFKAGMSERDMRMFEDNSGNEQRRHTRKRPDYKYKKQSRKGKQKNKGSVHEDGGLAIGRKGGVIHVPSNYV